MSTTQYDIEYCQSLSLTPILDFGFVVVVYNSCSSLCTDAPSAKKKNQGHFFLGELASVHVHRLFLVCNHVTRRPCWGSKQKKLFWKNLHENRVLFPGERNAFVLDHHHGHRDVTCKPAILGLDLGEFSLQHTQRQTTQSSSALGALMSFSVKLSDMERQIASYEKTIKRQTAEIDQLRAKLDSKSERSQFQSLQALLTSKMTTIKDEINTKDLVIERYRNKLRQLEEEITVRVVPLPISNREGLGTSRFIINKRPTQSERAH